MENEVKELSSVTDESPHPAQPNCYKCKHRRELPGNTHSRCAHPSVKVEASDELFASLGVGIMSLHVAQAAVTLNIKGDALGIRRGWFHWPYNFDPVWLRSCDGFEQK